MKNRVRVLLLYLEACVGIMALWYIDWITGHELNFFVFYFLPVSFVAWFLGFPGAVAASVISALAWFDADLLAHHVYSSYAYAVWNTTIRLVSFLAIARLVSSVRLALENERQTSEGLRRAFGNKNVRDVPSHLCPMQEDTEHGWSLATPGSLYWATFKHAILTGIVLNAREKRWRRLS